MLAFVCFFAHSSPTKKKMKHGKEGEKKIWNSGDINRHSDDKGDIVDVVTTLLGPCPVRPGRMHSVVVSLRTKMGPDGMGRVRWKGRRRWDLRLLLRRCVPIVVNSTYRTMGYKEMWLVNFVEGAKLRHPHPLPLLLHAPPDLHLSEGAKVKHPTAHRTSLIYT